MLAYAAGMGVMGAFLCWIFWQQRPFPERTVQTADADADGAAQPPVQQDKPGEMIVLGPQPLPQLPRATNPSAVVLTNLTKVEVETQAVEFAATNQLLSTNPLPIIEKAPPVITPGMVLRAQVALVRRAISPGPIDGVMGSQTRAALRAFQQSQGLPESGELDRSTIGQLRLPDNIVTQYVIRSNDVSRLRRVPPTWLEKSEQDQLDYESLLELVAEKCQANVHQLRSLNPNLDWERLQPGAVVECLDAGFPAARQKAAWIRISIGNRVLQAYGLQTNLLAHFPCSIAQRVEKRPLGTLVVETIVTDPNYRFDPAIFPESAEGRRVGRPLMIPPGPNNPVGTAWIGLNRVGYGIHGTPHPEQVGRTESHGCFRLANWSAEYLASLVNIGTPVRVEP